MELSTNCRALSGHLARRVQHTSGLQRIFVCPTAFCQPLNPGSFRRVRRIRPPVPLSLPPQPTTCFSLRSVAASRRAAADCTTLQPYHRCRPQLQSTSALDPVRLQGLLLACFRPRPSGYFASSPSRAPIDHIKCFLQVTRLPKFVQKTHTFLRLCQGSVKCHTCAELPKLRQPGRR